MPHSSDRGQFEPLVALAAVLAVTGGVVAYAETLDRRLPADTERDTAAIALDAIHEELLVAGVAVPDRLDSAVESLDGRWTVNATLQTRNNTWRYGPTPPAASLEAHRPIGVRIAPGSIRPGTLTVAVWR